MRFSYNDSVRLVLLFQAGKTEITRSFQSSFLKKYFNTEYFPSHESRVIDIRLTSFGLEGHLLEDKNTLKYSSLHENIKSLFPFNVCICVL